MGQYYMVLLEKDGERKILDRSVDGEYTAAKLMEHSWWKNPFVGTVCKMLLNNPTKIIWMGDYADDTEKIKELSDEDLYSAVWGDDVKKEGVMKNVLLLDGLFLVNHTKKEYINCDEYKKACIDEDGWYIHPLPLMTAIGNGLGGGDYYGINKDKVGYWDYDEISVEKAHPSNYTCLDIENISFVEN